MAHHYHREQHLIHLQIRTDDKGEEWEPLHRFNLTGDRSIPFTTYAKFVVDTATSLGQGGDKGFFKSQAQMVPVGRLTLVWTFPKSELIRAMSFVAIPGLIGPMLGPVAGGFIVGYFHWRLIFFINLPVGLLGLYFVYRHLPDYRQENPPPLDFVGLILFGLGIGLLAYVLEVFGEHTLGDGTLLAFIQKNYAS